MHKETLEVNGFKVELPIGLPEPLTTKVRDSYQTFLRASTNDVRRHLTCFSSMVPHMMRDWEGGENVLHPFGGLGACARIMDQCKPGLRHTLWDRDSVCVDYMLTHYDDVTLVNDSFSQLQLLNLSPFSAIMLDMSVNTIKTPTTVKMWEKVAGAPLDFIWFTDTACHKMHLNWRSYTRDFGHEIEPNNLSYMTAYSEWLENNFNLTIVMAMAEAGMTYSVVGPQAKFKRFKAIPYV